MLGGTSAPTTRAKAQQAAASAMKEASPRDPTLGGDGMKIDNFIFNFVINNGCFIFLNSNLMRNNHLSF